MSESDEKLKAADVSEVSVTGRGRCIYEEHAQLSKTDLGCKPDQKEDFYLTDECEIRLLAEITSTRCRTKQP